MTTTREHDSPPTPMKSASQDRHAVDNAQVPAELNLDLPTYQGPMDLLLDLIREHEVDIFDIPIALITAEYLRYLDQLQALDLTVGGEWLEMAATLVYIKSRTLLPPDPEEHDDELGPDPREELVRRLIEYQVFKWAAEQLDDRPQLQRDFFLPAPRAQEERQQVGPPKLREADISDLVAALRRVIEKQREEPHWAYEITREKLTLRGMILDISTILRDEPRIPFESLFGESRITRHRVVTTFLALLEMTKLRMIKLFQQRLGGPDTLIIERAVIDIVEVSQTLEFYDTP
ncbi:segregation/condensation protein A [Lujinxingia litoralis]|uniref:Segregation and condensation protein A n=1 Tax=Lujinxingia litoralis TaxID=2211119 RepID=A0A328CBE3_9DELT|nr:segregation/condensation protein A [Lujinxingia litoralis]RAL22787.1 segregation/condensation protein A [Lujinxingia litoralis]